MNNINNSTHPNADHAIPSGKSLPSSAIYLQKIYDFDEVEKTIISEIYHVKGRVDAIKDVSLIEIKTIDDKQYEEAPGPKKEHYVQANIGAFLLNKELNYNLKNITLIYVFRSLKRVETYNFLYNENVAKLYLERAKLIYQYIRTNTVPVLDKKDLDKCKFCEYKRYCRDF